MKTGYKETDVGIIPAHWDCIPIANVARLESGHTPSRREPSYWGGSFQWVSLHDTDALDGAEIYNTAQTITQEGLNNSSARLLPKGTVVFSRTATVGKACVLGREMATSQDFANYVCGPQLHNHFLVYLFRSMEKVWQSYMAGSIHNTIYMPVFKALKIACPPLHEQQAIATALSDVDALLGSLDRLIAKKRDLKQAAMQQLLTGKTRLPGFGKTSKFNETELGALPEDWSLRRIRDIAIVGRGRVISHREINGSHNPSYPVYSSQTYNDGIMGYLDSFDFDGEYITWTTDGVNAGTVFHRHGRFNCTNVCGTIMLKDDNAAFVSRVLGRITPRHVSWNLGNPKLMNDAMKRITLALPRREEQDAIAEVLSDMDAELAALEQRRDKTCLLKQGMMQELLTGRKRLI